MEARGAKRNKYQCETCKQTFDTVGRLRNHQKNSKIICTCCNRKFCNFDVHQKHLRSKIVPVTEIGDINRRIQPSTFYNGDAGFQVIRLGKSQEIQDWEKHGRRYKIINKAINHKFSYKDLENLLIRIYRENQNGFKISIGFGFVLYNPTTGKYKYFYVGENNFLFDRAFTIDSIADIETFMKKILAVDLNTNCYLQKPSSGWVLASITNVQMKLTDLHTTLLGSGDLPDYLKNLRCLVGLTHKRGIKYEDQLCMFRCLAIHLYGVNKDCLEKPAKALQKTFSEYRNQDFNGITIFDIPFLENCFKCSINVYDLESNGILNVIYLSPLKFKNPMYVNLHEFHFSYISNFKAFAQKFKCPDCGRIFDRNNNLTRHMKICSTGVKEIYPGGKFDASHETIFDKLHKLGIEIPERDRYYKFVSVFDFEAVQIKDNVIIHGRDINFVHEPATFSVCSNIPGYTNPVHVQGQRGKTQELVDKLVELQLVHQKQASDIMRSKFAWVIQKLEAMEKCESVAPHIRKRFLQFCDVLPIVTFNGQKYDIPLIRKYLPLSLKKLDDLPKFVIKKTRSYMAIGTERLKYLDLVNYLAAGTSLAKFYKAFKVKNLKSTMAYEWFDSLDKLQAPFLPQRTQENREAVARGEHPKNDPYYSLLKGKTVSNEDIDECEKVWKEQNMKTFGDYVRYYNDLDVTGLVEGIVKMSEIFRKQKLDIFKDGVSLPRLTQKQIFKALKKGQYFTTFSKKHSHIYKTVRDGIVGGASIVFDRYKEKGKKLKNTICQRILGFDCNSLYLWAMGEDQCTGVYRLREKKEFYKKHDLKDENYIKYSKKAIDWLNWRAKQDGPIRHAENHPHGEKRIENQYVDGFRSGYCYSFSGCFWHGHNCGKNYDKEKLEANETRKKKLQDMGYEVIEIWECEWDKMNIKVEKSDPVQATQEDIIKGVMEDEIYGIVKCDLHVPEHLKSYFASFPPLFKNTEIKFEDIGAHMKEYAASIGRTKGVKRSLISSMFGTDMIMVTTLFKEYIKWGLICTNIEWVLEYHKEPVFSWFVDKVANDRRRADLDPSMAIIGEMSKTSGNASYGRCCIDKTKHNSVIFCNEESLSKHVRDPYFKSMEELNGGIYEIVKGKRRVVLDTPVQIAINVYSLAKLNLLRFWKFLKDHLDDELYCLMETDTDSLYIAIARPTLDECVRQDRLCSWKKQKYDYFASESQEKVLFEGQEITLEQYEKRSPGKYKLEFEGEGMICLNSKVYHIWGELGCKTSSKGMQERNNLLKDDFLRVLLERCEHRVTNTGIIDDGTRKLTYTQTKKGLNYFYCKRIVLEDGITTIPLNI